MSSSLSGSSAWEGMGGPIRMNPVDFSDIIDDPTLDSCCRREMESQRRGQAVKKVLQQHDRVAAQERARLNLVNVNNSDFSGCRCCYDPNSDGGGDYAALLELRIKKQRQIREAETLAAEMNGEKKRGDDDEDSREDDDDDEELDEFMDDFPQDEATKAWEEQRRLELQYSLWHRQRAMEHGYGVHRPMHPTRILRAAGLVSAGTTQQQQQQLPPPPAAVIIHLVDPESTASASLDLYLEKVAGQEEARGTKFMRSGGRSTLLMDAELAQKALLGGGLDTTNNRHLSPETDLPALIAVRDGVVVNVCPRLRGLVDDNNYSNNNSGSKDEEEVSILPRQVHEWLDRAGVLLSAPPPVDELCGLRPEEEALMAYLSGIGSNNSNSTSNKNNNRDREPLQEYYNCGIPDCQKTYSHQHVGIDTEQQSGLVLAATTTSASSDDASTAPTS